MECIFVLIPTGLANSVQQAWPQAHQYLFRLIVQISENNTPEWDQSWISQKPERLPYTKYPQNNPTKISTRPNQNRGVCSKLEIMHSLSNIENGMWSSDPIETQISHKIDWNACAEVRLLQN